VKRPRPLTQLIEAHNCQDKLLFNSKK